MSDFLKYWDTRIDANERFFNNYPHIANFAFSECQALWDYMEEERNALRTRHNALVEYEAVLLGKLGTMEALKDRHNALVEAVAWERECEAVRNQLRPFRNWPELAESVDSYQAARSEVDRLMGEG